MPRMQNVAGKNAYAPLFNNPKTMKKRIITGVCVALFWIVLLAWAPTWCMFPVLLAVTLACVWEYCAMVKRGGMEVSRNLLMAAGAMWLSACYVMPHWLPDVFQTPWIKQYPRWFSQQILVLCDNNRFPLVEALLVAGLFALFCRVLFDPGVRRPFEMLGTTVLGFLYIPFMLGFFIRLAQLSTAPSAPLEITRMGILLAAYVALVVKAGDCGAYAAGMAFGKRKMFPRVSPKKSWVGLLGGLALSTYVSMACVWLAKNGWVNCVLLREFQMCEAAIVGFTLCAIGVIGDLVESMLKRATNTKDSGGMFPGMGGLLDVFDSLIFTVPAFYFYLLWMYA